MFWDRVSAIYDIAINIKNRRGNIALCETVASFITYDDVVLECASGTGMVSKHIATKCKILIATDFSSGMLKRAKKKLRGYSNVKVEKGDITALCYESSSFDKVVAANVIHLLENPMIALEEMMRVCKKDGKIIIPTYINKERNSIFIKLLGYLGASFKTQFSFDSYMEFFIKLGIRNAEYIYVDGRMPSAIAIIDKEKESI